MIDKAPDAYRTISEVADDLDLPQHVLRFWETRFAQIKPLKRGGGRRYYRPDDVELLKGIRHLLYSEGYTIKGVQRILKEQGPKAVQAFATPALEDEGDDGFDPIDAADAPLERPAAYEPPPMPVSAPLPRPVANAAPVNPAPAFSAPVAPPLFHGDSVDAGQHWQRLEPQFAAPPPHQWAEPVPAPPATVAYSPAPPLPPPAAEPVAPPRQPGTTAFMRGGLQRAGTPRAVIDPPVEPPVAPPQTSFAYTVRRTITPVPPPEADHAAPPRYSPLVEPELAEEAAAYAPSTALSEHSRRALQSALFELTECRRTIERIIAGRDR